RTRRPSCIGASRVTTRPTEFILQFLIAWGGAGRRLLRFRGRNGPVLRQAAVLQHRLQEGCGPARLHGVLPNIFLDLPAPIMEPAPPRSRGRQKASDSVVVPISASC